MSQYYYQQPHEGQHACDPFAAQNGSPSAGQAGFAQSGAPQIGPLPYGPVSSGEGPEMSEVRHSGYYGSQSETHNGQGSPYGAYDMHHAGPRARNSAGGSPFDPDYKTEEDWETPKPWYKKRLALIGAVLAALVVAAIALGVGLGVGLHSSKNNSDAARLSSSADADSAKASSTVGEALTTYTSTIPGSSTVAVLTSDTTVASNPGSSISTSSDISDTTSPLLTTSVVTTSSHSSSTTSSGTTTSSTSTSSSTSSSDSSTSTSATSTTPSATSTSSSSSSSSQSSSSASSSSSSTTSSPSSASSSTSTVSHTTITSPIVNPGGFTIGFLTTMI